MLTIQLITLILIGEKFLSRHTPTEYLQTSAILPTPVAEQVIEASTWSKVEHDTDTDELITNRVDTILNEEASRVKGSVLHLIRILLANTLILLTCLWSMANGKQPLAAACLTIFYGLACLGKNDTSVRLSLGSFDLLYILIGYAAKCIVVGSNDGYIHPRDLLYTMLSIARLAGIAGILGLFGVTTGVAAGLALTQISFMKENVSILDSIEANTSETVMMNELHLTPLLYWSGVSFATIFGFLLANRLRGISLSLLVVVAILLSQCPPEWKISTRLVFPPIATTCYLLQLSVRKYGLRISTQAGTRGLISIDLVRSFLFHDLTGVLIGIFVGVFQLNGEFSLTSINDVFMSSAVILLILTLSRVNSIHRYLHCHRKNHKAESAQDVRAKSTKPLHKCFKFLIRDFAGQRVYHYMHQPFLPSYGIYVCVFSWKKAKQHSLKAAEMGTNLCRPPTDECLEEIIFWLKFICMQRCQSFLRERSSNCQENAFDRKNIKNVFLVATHNHEESCGLSRAQKDKIMTYYKSVIQKHQDIYRCVDFGVSQSGEISVENRDDLNDGGIETLKKSFLSCATDVVQSCFPDQVPVHFWCWLKEKRDWCKKMSCPPFELLLNGHINVTGRNMSDYPRHVFCSMIELFCHIGEIFLVSAKEHSSDPSDFYIFYDIQFLIDFMKGIVTIGEQKIADRLTGMEWRGLNESGRADKVLLKSYLGRFYQSHSVLEFYDDTGLENQPLIISMSKLDFIFIINEEFFVPQLLPKHGSNRCPDESLDVDQLLWEHIFDFDDFEFHHEFVFFRLLSHCANHCDKDWQVYHNWASFTDHSTTQWFTLACEKKAINRGDNNRIYLRTSSDYNYKQSLTLLEDVISK